MKEYKYKMNNNSDPFKDLILAFFTLVVIIFAVVIGIVIFRPDPSKTSTPSPIAAPISGWNLSDDLLNSFSVDRNKQATAWILTDPKGKKFLLVSRNTNNIAIIEYHE